MVFFNSLPNVLSLVLNSTFLLTSCIKRRFTICKSAFYGDNVNALVESCIFHNAKWTVAFSGVIVKYKLSWLLDQSKRSLLRILNRMPDVRTRAILSTGQYCIYKKERCPEGLNYGFVYWDDDNFWNKNSKTGTLPDGVYNRNTKIEFCCRTDGNKNKPVVLPTSRPFFLLAYKLPRCQMVKWAVSSLEWIYYDTEDLLNNDDRGGRYPYDAATSHPTIYYCYYRGNK